MTTRSANDGPTAGQLGLSFESAGPPLQLAPATRRIWTVQELVGEVRQHVEREYPDIWVEGEISNLRSAPSGHVYFTLKDGESQLPVVLFRRQAGFLRIKPRDGMQILLRGKVSVYESRGQLQLIAETLEPLGAGSLQLAFEQLKARLAAEGFFAAERKRPMPAYPRTIGVITSPTGAVIRDILNVLGRRHSALNVLVYPAAVQGDSAAAQVAEGIAHFNRAQNVDLILIARGGGSLEDLAPFNTESLARAIAASDLPVVSAIGHETDFTISDFVADLRAPTPSAAAELITSAQHRVDEHVRTLCLRLERAVRYQTIRARERYARLSIPAVTARLQASFGRKQQRVDELRFQLESGIATHLSTQSRRLTDSTQRLMRQSVAERIAFTRQRLALVEQRLERVSSDTLRQARSDWMTNTASLHSLSPLAVLDRGYSIVLDSSGGIVRNPSNLALGEIVTTRVAEGIFESSITHIPMENDPSA